MQLPLILENDQLTATFSRQAGALCTLSHCDGWQWLWNKAPAEHYHPHNGGSFVMAPFCNRIRNKRFSWQQQQYLIEQDYVTEAHALHGNAWQAEWQLVQHNENDIAFSLESQFGPWHYRLEQHYALQQDSLLMVLTLTHLGQEPMPYGIGFHPWFPRDNDTLLYAPASRVWRSSADKIPTQLAQIPAHWQFAGAGNPLTGEVDNLFEGWPVVDGQCYASLTYPQQKKRLHIQASDNLARYMLYSSGDDFICFEPVSHTIDALNTQDGSLHTLKRGEVLEASMLLRTEHYG